MLLFNSSKNNSADLDNSWFAGHSIFIGDEIVGAISLKISSLLELVLTKSWICEVNFLFKPAYKNAGFIH